MRWLGNWFGWQPGEIMQMPYEDFQDFVVNEAEDRKARKSGRKG